MDKKSKILVVIFALILTASIAATLYRYIVLQDISFKTDENAFQEALLEE